MNFSADSLVFDWPACGPDHREVSSQISGLSIMVLYELFTDIRFADIVQTIIDR